MLCLLIIILWRRIWKKSALIRNQSHLRLQLILLSPPPTNPQFDSNSLFAVNWGGKIDYLSRVGHKRRGEERSWLSGEALLTYELWESRATVEMNRCSCSRVINGHFPLPGGDVTKGVNFQFDSFVLIETMQLIWLVPSLIPPPSFPPPPKKRKKTRNVTRSRRRRK